MKLPLSSLWAVYLNEKKLGYLSLSLGLHWCTYGHKCSSVTVYSGNPQCMNNNIGDTFYFERSFLLFFNLRQSASSEKQQSPGSEMGGCSWLTFIECEPTKSGIEFLLKPLMSRVRPGLKGERGHLDPGPPVDHVVNNSIFLISKWPAFTRIIFKSQVIADQF